MPFVLHQATTPGRRHASRRFFSDITKTEPEKALLIKKQRSGGRTQGKITVRHRGGGAKRYIRIVDFKRSVVNVPARVESIEYDPGRGARIALVSYPSQEKKYILAPQGLTVGDTIMSHEGTGDMKPGNTFALKDIPIGIMIHNIELKPGKGGVLVRGAGSTAQLLALEGAYAQVKLPSGEVRMINAACRATIGTLSNPDRRLTSFGKAGVRRHLGWRPTVRGKVMNPVDHPHGGGEGRNPIGLRYAKTPWGKHAMGVKTRKRKKWSTRFILSRRK